MGGGKGKVEGWGYGGNGSPCRCRGLKLFNELRIDGHWPACRYKSEVYECIGDSALVENR